MRIASLLLAILLATPLQAYLGFEHVQAEVRHRTGHCVYWQRSCREEEWFQRQIDCILKGGPLLRGEAVSIALANNPKLQVRLEALEQHLDRPLHCQLVLELRMIDAALRTVSQTTKAYNRRLGAIAKSRIARQLKGDMMEANKRAAYRKGWGFDSVPDRLQALSMAVDPPLDLETIKRESQTAGLQLRFSLGLDNCSPPVRLEGELALPPWRISCPKGLIARALCCRPDLQALQVEIHALKRAGHRLANLRLLEKRLRLRQLEVESEIRMAVGRYNAAHDELRSLTEKGLAPLKETADQLLSFWESGQVDILMALHAHMLERKAEVRALDLIVEALNALADIEYLIGGRLGSSVPTCPCTCPDGDATSDR